jgi:hypothetical protein
VANPDWFANPAIEITNKFFVVAVPTGLEPVTFGLGSTETRSKSKAYSDKMPPPVPLIDHAVIPLSE